MRPTVRLLRPFVQIVTVNDGPPRQRLKHQALHLRVLRIDNPIWAVVCTPFGYNCFLPGTEMQGAIVGGSRAFYEGQAVELATAPHEAAAGAHRMEQHVPRSTATSGRSRASATVSQVWAFCAEPCTTTSSIGPLPHRSALTQREPDTATWTRCTSGAPCHGRPTSSAFSCRYANSSVV